MFAPDRQLLRFLVSAWMTLVIGGLGWPSLRIEPGVTNSEKAVFSGEHSVVACSWRETKPTLRKPAPPQPIGTPVCGDDAWIANPPQPQTASFALKSRGFGQIGGPLRNGRGPPFFAS